MGCSHTRGPTSTQSDSQNLDRVKEQANKDLISDSGVDIDYTLGRDHYLFHAISTAACDDFTSLIGHANSPGWSQSDAEQQARLYNRLEWKVVTAGRDQLAAITGLD